jgi:chromate reductase
MNPIHLVGISGSLRTASYNTALLRAAFDTLPGGVSAEVLSLEGIPIYNHDEERAAGMPHSVRSLRAAVEAADGIVFASPEYNWSMTGAMKNAVDWLSRGPDSPLDFKPAAIVGAGGASGTARSQRHLRDTLGHNHLRIVAEPQVMVSGTAGRFDGATLVDEAVMRDLREMIDRLIEVVERFRSSERVPIEGSILVIGASADWIDEAVRGVTEAGYRTLTAHAATDALQIASARRIAGVVLDEGLDPFALDPIGGIEGGAVRIVIRESRHAGVALDVALRKAADS